MYNGDKNKDREDGYQMGSTGVGGKAKAKARVEGQLTKSKTAGAGERKGRETDAP